jgi:integrase
MTNKKGSRRRFGAIRQLPSGQWQARYPGPDGVMRPADTTFRTKTEAAEWLVDKEAEIRAGDWINPEAGKITLAKYAESWVVERPKMRPTTRERSATLVRLHIAPYLGDMELGDIRDPHVRRWYKQLGDNKVGAATVARAYQLLKSIFNTAVDDEVIRRNPCRIKGAAVYKSEERPVLTITEVYALADKMPGRYRALVLLGTFTGLRWGELVGLKRRNVDLEACTVRVESIVVELGSGRMLKDQAPKSEAGRRTVAFPAELKPMMEAHLADFVGAESTAHVFTSPMGMVLRRANFRATWVDAIRAAGLSDVRFHDLRHTGATIAAQAGATLKELMLRIGHSTERAALNYQHAAKGRDQEIASALDKLIKKETGKGRARQRARERKPRRRDQD